MDQIADHFPKLMPLWHDQSTHDVVNKDRRFLEDKLPDYGGIGVDISLIEKGSQQSIVKHTVDSVHFKAQVCTLPFLPANKVAMGVDPCLSSLHASRENFKRFCLKLETLRSQVKLKRCENYKKEILSSYKIVQKMCRSGNYTKVLLPEILIELATIFPKSLELPDVNLYSGCLASCNKANKNPILLYPTGKNLSKLAVTTLEHSSNMYKTFQPDESQLKLVKLDSGTIQQINCVFDGCCYILKNKVVHFVDFNDLSNISHFRCLKQNDITNIGASQYCPIELISIYENGAMELFNIDQRQTLWSLKKYDFSEGIVKTFPLSCSFGSHPKSVLCITDRQLYSFDVRFEDQKGCVLFSSYHPTCYMNEHLTCMKGGLAINPFQYFISSSHHLFLCDERYPNKPVLLWNHLLKSSPLYCDVTSYNPTFDSNDAVVLLGTQKSQELVSFSINSKHSSFGPTISLGPPLFLSSPSDCFRSLKFHCADIDKDIVKRLSCPLVGITSIPHTNKAGFTAFQITSPGDVFFQDFRINLNIDNQNVERTYRTDMGCVLTPPNRIWPHLSKWNRNCKKTQTHSEACDISRIHVNLKDFLYKQSEISSECNVCATYKLAYNREIISNETCPTCGLDNTQSEHLMKASKEMSLIIGPTTEDCDLSEFDINSFFQFTDSFSKKILGAWSYKEGTDYVVNTESQSEEYNCSDVSKTTDPPTSSYHSTSVKSVQSSVEDISKNISQLHSQNSFSLMDETMADISLYSQRSMEEFVLPSQEVRPLVGETLRTPKQMKTKLSKKITSSAGF